MAMKRKDWRLEEVEKGRCLVEAAANGNYDELVRLLNSGVSVNAEEYNKSLFYASRNYVTPLQISSSNGHLTCVRLLIEHGADVNAKDRFDVTAAHTAAENGHYLCLKALLDAGAECCVPTKYSKKGCYTAIPHPGGTTPLHLAAANNHISCVKELIQSGADYNAVDERGRTSLFIAAQTGFNECVLAHLRNAIGRDILSLPGYETGDTPLHFAVKHGMVECIAELLKHGSDVNHLNYAGGSPLHYAVSPSPDIERFSKEILHLLVVNGYNADVNLPDASGLTPLHYVSFSDGGRLHRRPELAALLIAFGADATITNQRGYNLIQSEFKNRSKDCTILKAIMKSTRNLQSLSSLNISAPPALPAWIKSALQMQPHSPANWTPPSRAESPSCLPLTILPPSNSPLGYGDMSLLFNLAPTDLPPPMDWLDYTHYHPTPHHGSTYLWLRYNWYNAIASNPRSLQHNCRVSIRSALGYKRLRHVKDLPIPVSLQHYLLLGYEI